MEPCNSRNYGLRKKKRKIKGAARLARSPLLLFIVSRAAQHVVALDSTVDLEKASLGSCCRLQGSLKKKEEASYYIIIRSFCLLLQPLPCLLLLLLLSCPIDKCGSQLGRKKKGEARVSFYKSPNKTLFTRSPLVLNYKLALFKQGHHSYPLMKREREG